MYEVGAGTGDAVFEWSCAWQAEAVTLHRAKKDLGPALRTLATLTTMPEYVAVYDNGLKADFVTSLEKAQLGDVSGFMAQVRANCVDLIS